MGSNLKKEEEEGIGGVVCVVGVLCGGRNKKWAGYRKQKGT